MPVLTYMKNRRPRSVHYKATTVLSQPKAFTKQQDFSHIIVSREGYCRSDTEWRGDQFALFQRCLWWVLESPPLAQSDAICVLSRCHKLVLSHQERYPWSPLYRSSFFPVGLSKFEYITSLGRIGFAKCFWQRLVLSWHARDWRSELRHQVNLSCCRSWAFCVRSIHQKICVPHKTCVMSYSSFWVSCNIM